VNDRLLRVVTAVLLFLVPILFVTNVLQSFRFSRLRMQTDNSRVAITQTVEENKRLIAGIAGLRSPARIRAIAGEQLQMSPVSIDDVIRIDVSGSSHVP